MEVLDFANQDRLSDSTRMRYLVLCSSGVHHALQKIPEDNNLKIAQKSKDASGEKELLSVLVLLGNVWAHRGECRAPPG